MAASDRPRRGEAALVAGLLAGKSIRQAAADAGISERSGRRLAAQPHVRQALAEGRAAAWERATHVLADGAIHAAAQLRLLASGATFEHVRLAAAKAVLEYAAKGIELVDLIERVAVLEERLAAAARSQGRGQGWGA